MELIPYLIGVAVIALVGYAAWRAWKNKKPSSIKELGYLTEDEAKELVREARERLRQRAAFKGGGGGDDRQQ
jgi:predicted negative regulator of RcsB-dependent stress response